MIFYFSATGNSRYVAERIAAVVGDKTVSIAECYKSQNLFLDKMGESVGIVSPTYAWGLPVVVQEFLQALMLSKKPEYLWFVATYGTTPGQVGRFADDILRDKGFPLSARFSVKMPDTWTPLFDLSDKETVRGINEAAEWQIDNIISKIQACVHGDFIENKVPWFFAKVFHSLEYEFMRRTSRFEIEESCIGCGLCAKNCPVSAIELREEKPVWVSDRCAMCLGCLHRCPKFAIQYGSRTKRHGQYMHPGMKNSS